jgi:hypothetical protein
MPCFKQGFRNYQILLGVAKPLLGYQLRVLVLVLKMLAFVMIRAPYPMVPAH